VVRIPTLAGLIRRRLLLNFRADPEVVQALLPAPFKPQLYRGWAIVGICLIRLEQLRPLGLPSGFGLRSENAAHRFAVNWQAVDGSLHQGVYVPRRDSSSLLNNLAGGRLVAGEQHHAHFVVDDNGYTVQLRMRSGDDQASIEVVGTTCESLPRDSIFDLAAASSFFEHGALGYTATKHGQRFDGLTLNVQHWHVRPFAVDQFDSSYFRNQQNFPVGSIEFDHGLIMRDVQHTWQSVASLSVA